MGGWALLSSSRAPAAGAGGRVARPGSAIAQKRKPEGRRDRESTPVRHQMWWRQLCASIVLCVPELPRTRAQNDTSSSQRLTMEDDASSIQSGSGPGGVQLVFSPPVLIVGVPHEEHGADGFGVVEIDPAAERTLVTDGTFTSYDAGQVRRTRQYPTQFFIQNGEVLTSGVGTDLGEGGR